MIIPTSGFSGAGRAVPGTRRRRSLRALVLAGGALGGILLGAVPGVVGVAQAKSPDPLPPVTSAQAKQEANLVDAEDVRLRTMFAKFSVLKGPSVVQVQGSLPTLLLPARPAPYTTDEVVAAGGMRREVDGGVLVIANIVVGPNARLVIDQKVGTVRLASSPAGFVALTSWRGAIEINGNPQQPTTVVGWDIKELKPDANAVDGRAYIRAMGGELIVRNAKVSNLGFWDGRTGGVAWTGSKGQPSTGGAANSTFSSNVWGVYISGSENVQMINVRTENNDRTGIAVHRDAISTLISGSTATQNHGEGITIDRASGSRVMRSTVTDNAGDGITLDGRGIGIVATATGIQVNQVKGTVVEGNTVSGNGRYGIRVLGGEDNLVRNNNVSGSQVGIIVKSGSNGTQILGNTVGGVADAAIQVGPDAKRTAIDSNTLADGRMGIITENATANIITKNKISKAREFAVTVRGQADGTAVGGNTLSGAGWRAVDINKAIGITLAAVRNNDTSGWIPRLDRPWYSIFERHPALFVWSFMVLLPILGWWAGRRKRKRAAEHPYPESDLLVRRMTAATSNNSANGVPSDVVTNISENTEVITMSSPAAAGLRRMPVAAGQSAGRTTGHRGAAIAEDTLPAVAAAASRVPASRQAPPDGFIGTWGGPVTERDQTRLGQDDNPTMDGLRYQRDRLHKPAADPLEEQVKGGYGRDAGADGRSAAFPSAERSYLWDDYSSELGSYPANSDESGTTIVSGDAVSVVDLDAAGPARGKIFYDNGRSRDRYGRRDPQ